MSPSSIAITNTLALCDPPLRSATKIVVKIFDGLCSVFALKSALPSYSSRSLRHPPYHLVHSTSYLRRKSFSFAMDIDNLFMMPPTTDVSEQGPGNLAEVTSDSTAEESQDLGQVSLEESVNDSDSDELDPFVVDDSDSFDIAFNKTELKVDGMFERFGPQAAALLPHLHTPSADIPLASKPFPHTLKKVPGASDTALRIQNDGPLQFYIIGQLAHHDNWTINKVGPYLDMIYQQNGRENLTLDTLKRGKAKLVLRTLDFPKGATEEGNALVRQANERFNRLAAFLSVIHSNYQQAQSERDGILYPNGVSGSSWLYQGSNFYGMTISTQPIFANVPQVKTSSAPVIRLQGDYLAPVDHIQEENRRRNRKALEVSPENESDLTLLGNWPDPEGHIRKLAESVYLGAVRVTEPAVFDPCGSRIHPSVYSKYLVPGVRVAVRVTHKLWDITSQRNGGPVANPSRHCVAVAEEIHIIPEDEEDIRDTIHQFEARARADAGLLRERERVAEEERETSILEEAARVDAAAERAKERAKRKEQREERLKSMWEAMSSPSTSAVASSSRRSNTPDSATASSTSIPSTPSPSKRKAFDDLPATPSPAKRQTARMSTGGKPPRVIRDVDEGRSTRSKGKGKAKAEEAMDIDP